MTGRARHPSTARPSRCRSTGGPRDRSGGSRLARLPLLVLLLPAATLITALFTSPAAALVAPAGETDGSPALPADDVDGVAAVTAETLADAMAGGPDELAELLDAPAAETAITSAVGSDPAVTNPELPTWTLEDVFRKVIDENEAVGRARRDVDIAQANYRGAWARVVPQLSFGGSVTRYDDAQSIDLGETEEGDPIEFEVIPQTDWAYNFKLEQVLYAGGRPIRALKLTDNLRDVSIEALESTRQNVFLAVAAAFLEIVKAERGLEISRTDMELARRQKDVADARFRAGEAIRVSVLRADQAMLSAERGMIQAQNRLDRAKESFAALTGIRGEYQLLPPRVAAREVGELEPLVEEALRERPEMKIIELQVRNARLRKKIAVGELLPVLNAEVNYFKQKSQFPTDSWFSGILGLSFPIFDGGLAMSHKRVAEQEEAQVLLDRSQMEKSIREEVTSARLTLLDLEKARRVLEEEVRVTRLTYEDISRFYAVGEATDLDLLAAQQQLITAERLLSDVINDELLADYALQTSMGIFARHLAGEPPAGNGMNDRGEPAEGETAGGNADGTGGEDVDGEAALDEKTPTSEAGGPVPADPAIVEGGPTDELER